MGHSIQLVVGRGETVSRFLRRWPQGRASALEDGWLAVPLNETLSEAIAARYPSAASPIDLKRAPPGLVEALADATSDGGGLAYVETDYWGGSGEQSATAWVNGREAVAPVRETGAGGPINQALRAIGVGPNPSYDEFDTIGLGLRRSMSDYEPDATARLRQALPTPNPTPKPALPLWGALFLIAGFIALGVAIAMMR